MIDCCKQKCFQILFKKFLVCCESDVNRQFVLCLRSEIGSQCSSYRAGDMWSRGFKSMTNLAAALITLRSEANVEAGK